MTNRFITGFPLKKDRNKAIEILKERGYEKKDIVEYLYKFYSFLNYIMI